MAKNFPMVKDADGHWITVVSGVGQLDDTNHAAKITLAELSVIQFMKKFDPDSWANIL